MDTQAGAQFATNSHQTTIDLQAGIITSQQKEIDRLNILAVDNAAECERLKETIEWYQGEAGKRMGEVARAEIDADADEIALLTRQIQNLKRHIAEYCPAAPAAPSGQAEPAGTPAAKWREKGEPDPHGTSYDCERAALCMGDLTDDELANEAFLNYDRQPSFDALRAGKAVMPIAYMTAVKDRIRWLSRALVKATAATAPAAPLLAQPEQKQPQQSGSAHPLVEPAGQQDAIVAARALLESKWDAEGDCGSCAWHACLYEHGVDDSDIAYALQNNGGILELSCISKDADEPSSHRGVKIKISPDAAKQTKVPAGAAGCSQADIAGAAPLPELTGPSDEQLIALNYGERYFSETPSKYDFGTQYHCGAPGLLGFARAAISLAASPSPAPTPTEPQWISVEDRLPEVGTWCNVLVDRELGDFFDRLNKPRFDVYGAQLRSIDSEGYAEWQRWQMSDGGPMGLLRNVAGWLPLPESSPASRMGGITSKESAEPAHQQEPSARLTNEQIRTILHKYSRYMGQPGYYSDTEFACLQDVVGFAREVLKTVNGPECAMCNDHGSVGHAPDDYYPCPDCSAETAAPGASTEDKQ